MTDEKSRNDMNYDEWNKDFCLKYFKCKFDVYIFQICSSSGEKVRKPSNDKELDLESIVPKQQHQNLPEQPLAKYVL